MSSTADNDNNKQREAPLASLLPTLLKRESFSDVKLEGTDGKQVAANRHVLAVRSAVFDKLLCGSFQEADTAIVKFDFSSDVLRAVVEYCYTDTAELLQNDRCACATTVVSLMQAADYFGLNRLQQKTKAYTSRVCTDLFLAFEFFQVCKTVSPGATDVTTEIKELALGTIRKTPFPEEDMEDREKVLSSIDSSVLECILKDDKMEVTEYSMFLLLKAWADTPRADSTQRREGARQLVKYISLANIAAEDLANVVEQSNLVTSDQLHKAYKTQALRVNHPASKKPRYSPMVWMQSRTNLLSKPQNYQQDTFSDKLDCPPMKSGIHVWKLQVERLEGSNLCEVGVIMSHELDRFDYIGDHRNGWAYTSNGEGICNGIESDVNVQYTSGSTVTLTLDLRPGNGTLSASVDDGDTFQIFNNMLLKEEVSTVGLVPAATVTDGDATVRFLGFDRAAA